MACSVKVAPEAWAARQVTGDVRWQLERLFSQLEHHAAYCNHRLPLLRRERGLQLTRIVL